MKVKVVGAGLAGCEAAWQLAKAGIDVALYEMKPQKYSPAHSYHGFAELVCSNSLKAARLGSAAGLLKAEMRRLGSLIVSCAEECSVPAGGALAVDRAAFSDAVTRRITSCERIHVLREEVAEIPDGDVIIATGPLTSAALSDAIQQLCGNALSFYDAAAPIVAADSINYEIAFPASRYGKGEADYMNCPMDKEEYERFYHALITAESAELHEFDQAALKVYEGCMPVEVLAKRGVDAIRFGPLKPVGLRDPRTGNRPYAVVQLRKENCAATMYNLVGFQTNLKFGEQRRVFSLIPGLENAEFIRYGVMHRNTFIDSPRLLDCHFRFKNRQDNLYFAGQITGVEGYIESAASGIASGLNLARRLHGLTEVTLPQDTMLGALAQHISDSTVTNFQPMGSNMGLLPPLQTQIRDKKQKYQALAERALKSLENSLEEYGVTAIENHC